MKKNVITFLLIFLICIIGANVYAQLGTQYKWLHPTPQGNDLRWVKMFTASNWYAIGFGGTFIKTTNAGVTWQVKELINGVTDAGLNITCYDGYFLNTHSGWVCGGSGLILKSSNGGNTWDTTTAVSSGATWYDIDFINATTGFIAGTTSGRVAYTTNGGANWTQAGTIPSATYYSVYAKDLNNILVSSTSGNVRKTTDGGATWSTISTGASATLYRLKFLNGGNTGYVCGSASAIRYTTDFGSTWTSTNTGVASSTFYDLDFANTTLPSPTLNQDFESTTFPPVGWDTTSLMGTVKWKVNNKSFCRNCLRMV